MIDTYTISGMTCSGCKKSVEEALLKLEAIDAVNINLETAEAKITMNKKVEMAILQDALSGSYTISKKEKSHIFKRFKI
ncbi:heavy-metal-associated domain-containing protein [Bizionia myxarmorum]|nr:heavy metal-associated domain-containing protein [Bizionia myxarmorum]